MTKDKAADKITEICSAISDLLLYKNKRYGNAALEPQNVFFKGSGQNSIAIRLDDKLSRIKNGPEIPRTNDIVDLIGYEILLLVNKNVSSKEIQSLKD